MEQRNSRPAVLPVMPFSLYPSDENVSPGMHGFLLHFSMSLSLPCYESVNGNNYLTYFLVKHHFSDYTTVLVEEESLTSNDTKYIG